jgi:hypothetical protein
VSEREERSDGFLWVEWLCLSTPLSRCVRVPWSNVFHVMMHSYWRRRRRRSGASCVCGGRRTMLI